MRLKDFFRLVRFEHALMLAVAVFISEVIVLGKLPAFDRIFLLSLLVPIFSEMGSFALNDYLDIKSDRINKKLTPLVRGVIEPSFAFYFGWLSLALSTVLAFFINWNALVIAFIFNVLAIAYNYKLKDLPLLGNLYIGLTMAIPFIFGNYVISPVLHPVAAALAVIGFLCGLAREIVKSTEDMEGDLQARKAKTLPIVIGRKQALVIALLLYIIFIPISYLPFSYGLKTSPIPMIFLILANGGVLYTTFLLFKSIQGTGENTYLKQARKISLISLGIGLVGYLVAVL